MIVCTRKKLAASTVAARLAATAPSRSRLARSTQDATSKRVREPSRHAAEETQPADQQQRERRCSSARIRTIDVVAISKKTCDKQDWAQPADIPDKRCGAKPRELENPSIWCPVRDHGTTGRVCVDECISKLIERGRNLWLPIDTRCRARAHLEQAHRSGDSCGCEPF
jgi:hypothetical protein